MAFGTLVCLIPQGVVDRVTTRPKSKLGRAADVGILAVVLFGLTAGLASQAHAQGAEHVKPGGGMGEDGVGWAAKNRPTNPTAEKAMKELLCVCGCPRESIFDCKCKTASDLRAQVQAFIEQRDETGKPVFDLSTSEGRTKAYDAVLAAFVSEYGGEQVLATPRSKFSWLFPSLAVMGGLSLIVVVGRRMVGRGKAAKKEQVAQKPATEDDEYADKLDDELAGVD
jgi:cytochrome c-type biogenesis protein CcmH